MKVHFVTGLNPLDYKIQKLGVMITKFPAVLGQDGAGVIDEVGNGVDKFKTGDRVYALHLLLFLTISI